MVTSKEINGFLTDGFVKVEAAFSGEHAAACREILWKAVGYDPNDRNTWKKPVVRIAEIPHPLFVEVANTSVLTDAYNQLAGEGNWVPKKSMGSFPIRFPHSEPAGDTGWHVDASYSDDNDFSDFSKWRVNIHSKGRALLMLFLFSDVGEADAPTAIRKGSHRDVARVLEPAGDAGMTFMELAQQLENLPAREEVLATGAAGTVYLCHPFLVHAAQEHRGTNPKFMAQPALQTKKDYNIYEEGRDFSKVEEGIRLALSL